MYREVATTSLHSMYSNSSLATQGPSDDGPQMLALRRARVDRALMAASSPLNDVSIDTTIDHGDVNVRVTTLGPSLPRPPTPVGTPRNSQTQSWAGYMCCPCLGGCCSAAVTKPTGRDGIEQMHVFFHREQLELSACEHKRLVMINADGNTTLASSLFSSCLGIAPPGDRSLSPAELTAATKLGQQLATSEFLTTNQIQLIVVSPLRRALQTALKLFPIGTHQVPFLVSPLLTELESISGSVGSNSSDLKCDFPEFHFDLQENWWITDFDPCPHNESVSSIKHRINQISSMLLRRPELRMVVIGHTGFLAQWSKRPAMKQLEIKTFELCAD